MLFQSTAVYFMLGSYVQIKLQYLVHMYQYIILFVWERSKGKGYAVHALGGYAMRTLERLCCAAFHTGNNVHVICMLSY